MHVDSNNTTEDGNHGGRSIESSEEYETISNMTFSSEEEAWEFFNGYAKKKGFSIRRDDVKYNGGIRCFRCFLCSCAGQRDEKYTNLENRQKNHRALTRFGCPAKLSIRLNMETGRWFVCAFNDAHSHVLAGEQKAPFLRSHRSITDAHKDKIRSLRISCLRQCQIMEVMEQEHGGYQNVGFIMKDLYGFAFRDKEERTRLGDAVSVLNLMQKRKETEIDFFWEHSTNDNGHLTRLFWSDAISRHDYQSFGDVLMFDSTYRVNRYNMPFIPFVGVNNHRSTVIFGCGIVNDETAESYEWLLSTFLKAVYQNKPSSIITDGCPSMAKAIRIVIPESTHRLCSWHVEKNMKSHLHFDVHDGFRKFMYSACDPIEFEKEWEEFVKSFGTVKTINWLQMMYNSREQWAAAYLRKMLFLEMQSTQRNEGLNARLHKHLDGSMRLLDLVYHYEHCLSRIRRNVLELDCKASQSVPFTTIELEKDVARIYTPRIFLRICKELNFAKEYELVEMEEIGGTIFYVLELKNNREKSVFVEFCGGENLEDVKCTCMLLESAKIPCCHIFKVLMEMKKDTIPDCCIQHRWIKTVNNDVPLLENSMMTVQSNERQKRKCEMLKLAGKIIHEASNTEDEFLNIMELLKDYQLDKKRKKEDTFEDVGDQQVETDILFDVADPEIKVGRGAPKKMFKSSLEGKKNRCGRCGERGHYRTTCPKQS